MRVHYCEPEHRSILGDDDDGDANEIPSEKLFKCFGSGNQHEEMIPETQESHVFEIKELCVNASYASDEDG